MRAVMLGVNSDVPDGPCVELQLQHVHGHGMDIAADGLAEQGVIERLSVAPLAMCVSALALCAHDGS